MTSNVEIGTTRDGTTELRRHWAAADPWAALLIVHGLGEHSGRYERTGSLLAEAGIDTYGFDLVGHGASGGRRGHIDRWSIYHEQVLDNMAPVFTSGVPSILLGHSLGGLIAASYLLSLHRQPDLAVLSSPALDGNVPAWQRSAAPVISRVLPKLALLNPIKGDQLSRDEAVGRDYFNDPLVITKTTTLLGNLAFEQMALVGRSLDAYEIRTLVIHGGEDTLVPTSFSEPLEDCPMVDRVVYPDLRHEMFNEPEGPEIVADVVAWIRRQLDA